MCGVTGMIGVPLHEQAAKLSYQLNTELLKLTVQRGSHATGTYALLPPSEGREKNRVFIYKLDAPSPQFVGTKKWKGMSTESPFVLLGHCRFATHGDFKEHINNHPHFSEDKKLAIVHNGVISGYETLKRKFPCTGECDSEVILRIIESEDAVIAGIQKTFDEISGSMACLLTEYDTENMVVRFHAFRNDGNPLVYIDLREELGQIFFASTEDIAKKGLKNSGMPKKVREKAVVEIPSYEIWTIDQNGMEFDKIEIEKPVSTTTTYTSGRTAYGTGGGTTNRSLASTTGGSTTTTSQSTSTTTTTTKGNKDIRRRCRALLDTILENMSELDVEFDNSDEPFGSTLENIERELKDIAWDLETIVNPAVSTDESGDTTIVDTEYFD